MLRYTTDRFRCLVRHPARKRSGSILTTPEPAWGQFGEDQCTQFRVIVVPDPQTNTDRANYNTLRH